MADFEYLDRPTDDVPKIRVICIGAGISGILSAIRLPQKIENLDLAIYEKSRHLGGTWFDNHYPGLACDIPAAAYQLSFESNTQWSAYYAPGREIQKYWEGIAAKYDVYRFMNFNAEVTEARWDQEEGLWRVQIKDTVTGRTWSDSANVLISATGILNEWNWPTIPGLHDFKGHLIHTADWDDSYDVTGKNIALIGGGSSGIQVLPQIQPIVNRVDHYMKGKTWIAYRVPGKEQKQGTDVPEMNPENHENFQHSSEELERWRNDPKKYLEFRCAVEDDLNSGTDFVKVGSELHKTAQKMFEDVMQERLKNKPEVYKALKPDYPAGCRRLTPGPGYLNAIAKENVDFLSMGIKMVTEKGIIGNDGVLREVDAIVCATGFDTGGKPRIPTYGLDGISLSEVYDPTPEAYLSMCPAKMPNYFIYLGPNGGPGTGSTVIMLEQVAQYICKSVSKLQRESLVSMVPKDDVITQFGQYVDRYMTGIVYGQNCKSWFKRGIEDGRVVYVYPGGSMSGIYVLQNPRWEDFNWTRKKESSINMWAWLGNGIVKAQRDGTTTSHYLRNLDIPPIPKKLKKMLIATDVSEETKALLPVESVFASPKAGDMTDDSTKPESANILVPRDVLKLDDTSNLCSIKSTVPKILGSSKLDELIHAEHIECGQFTVIVAGQDSIDG